MFYRTTENLEWIRWLLYAAMLMALVTGLALLLAVACQRPTPPSAPWNSSGYDRLARP